MLVSCFIISYILTTNKGNDENIIADFGDLSYYCQVGSNECTAHRDMESRAQFRAINACLGLLRADSLHKIGSDLEAALEDYVVSQHRLSTTGVVSFFRHLILRCDIKFPINLLSESTSNDNNNNLNKTQRLDGLVDESISELMAIQQGLLDELQLNSGEETERYVDRQKSCYDNLSRIKNLFNPLLLLLVHVKLRLGASIMLKAVSLESSWFYFI